MKVLTAILIGLPKWERDPESNRFVALLTLDNDHADFRALDLQCLIIAEQAPERENIQEVKHDPHIGIAPRHCRFPRVSGTFLACLVALGVHALSDNVIFV